MNDFDYEKLKNDFDFDLNKKKTNDFLTHRHYKINEKELE